MLSDLSQRSRSTPDVGLFNTQHSSPQGKDTVRIEGNGKHKAHLQDQNRGLGFPAGSQCCVRVHCSASSGVKSCPRIMKDNSALSWDCSSLLCVFICQQLLKYRLNKRISIFITKRSHYWVCWRCYWAAVWRRACQYSLSHCLLLALSFHPSPINSWMLPSYSLSRPSMLLSRGL